MKQVDLIGKGGIMFNKTHTLYEIGIDRLSLHFSDGTQKSLPEALSNGRANYIIFEELIRHYAGLQKAKGSDHQDVLGRKYEQKSFKDVLLHPKSEDLFRCSASSTFAANNNGPRVKKLLESGDYAAALDLCKKTGYNKNDFYIFTNTGGFKENSVLKYLILPTEELLRHLDSKDPRMVSRATLLGLVKSKVVIV